MKWITREKVKVDRVACPWLIKKFVDAPAEFIFVPANQVEARARQLGATPFDIEGCELGRHGEDASFNSILQKYNLTDLALVLLGDGGTGNGTLIGHRAELRRTAQREGNGRLIAIGRRTDALQLNH